MALDFRMIAIACPVRAVEFFRGSEQDVEGERGGTKQQGPPSPPDGDLVFDPPFVDRFDNQQIDIAVTSGLAIGIRAEEDDLLRMKLIDQNAQIGKELSGDLMHGMTRVTNHILANLRADDGRLVHTED